MNMAIRRMDGRTKLSVEVASHLKTRREKVKDFYYKYFFAGEARDRPPRPQVQEHPRQEGPHLRHC